MKNPHNTFIRIATTEDIPLIQQMAEIAYPPTYLGIEPPEMVSYMMGQMYSTESLLRQMEDGQEYCIVFEGEKAMGYISLRKETEDTCFIEKLYLLPEARRKGLGRTLVQTAIDYARTHCVLPCRLQLHVNRYNPSVEFYRHLGFDVIGQGDPYVGDGFQMHYFIMELRIEYFS